MKTKMSRKTEQWVDLIANCELPAITSTAKLLDKFSIDDKSSLPKLTEAILHDQALSSCLLKVANTTQRIGVNKVTTISRASIVLGVQTVKNICLTSKLVSSLLSSKSFDNNVYEQLTQRMASSFFAGMLAKMMVPNYSDEVQEEVYLAAMLYRIGETAFWSTSGKTAKLLANYHADSAEDFDEYCLEKLGTSFNDLSKGLAGNWNLSDLLIKSLDQPINRTDEVKVIYFADKLSATIAKPEGSEEDYQHLLEQIAAISGLTVKQLTVEIEKTRKQSAKLLTSYGADILTKRIKPLPQSSDFENPPSVITSHDNAHKEKALLAGFMKLTTLMQSSKDFNDYLQLSLESLSEIFSFDRSSFLILISNKTRVMTRLAFNCHGKPDDYRVALDLKESDNVIDRVICSDTAVLINDHRELRWRDLITQDISNMIDDGIISYIPVKVGKKVIGIICLQLFNANNELSAQEFKQICGYIDHLNMCLTMIKYS